MAVVINGQVYENLVQIVAESGALNDDFIQGNSQVISFKLDAKFSSTLTSFRCFPNLATLIIMKTDGVVSLNPNILDGTSVSRIIVPNSLLSAYQTAYPAWASLFDTWQFQIEFTIEHIAGQSTTLTKDYIDEVVAIAGGSAYATIVTKVIVDSNFTDYEAGALDYLFEVFDNMETIDSPWLKGNSTSGYYWLISGTGTLTSQAVSDAVSNYSLQAVTVDTLFVKGFSSYASGCLSPIDGLSDVTKLKIEADGSFQFGTALPSATTSSNKIADLTLVYSAQNITWNRSSNQIANTKITNLKVISQYPIRAYGDETGFPSFLAGMENLQSIDLSQCGLYGDARSWFSMGVNLPLLKSIDCGDVSQVTQLGNWYWFGTTGNIQHLAMTGLAVDADFSKSSMNQVPQGDWQSIINGLADLTGQAGATLKIGSTNLAKLAQADLDIATAKNWSVVA